MSWLLDNPLTEQTGFVFLLVYFFITVFTLFICWLATHYADPTRKLPKPQIPHQPDPLEIAYLRGGELEVGLLCIFGLIQRGYLRTVTPLSKEIEINPHHPSEHHLTDLERAAFAPFDHPPVKKTLREIFFSEFLLPHLKPKCKTIQAHLEEKRMLTPRIAKKSAWIWGGFSYAFLISLGVYRVFTALILGKDLILPILFLMGFSFIALIWICKLPRQTHRGRFYIQRLQFTFRQLQNPKIRTGLVEPSLTRDDPNLFLLVAIFGIRALGNSIYQTLYRRPRLQVRIGLHHQTDFMQYTPGTVIGCGACGVGGCGGCGSSGD